MLHFASTRFLPLYSIYSQGEVSVFSRSLIFITATATLSSCATTTTTFSPSEACSVSSPTLDSREVQCQFPKSAFTRKFKFQANFSGGHDDTKARIEPFIDNAPLSCDEGSKKSLFGEDGDVSLWCTFSIADHPHSNGVFKVTVRWNHAEYTNYEVTTIEQ